MSDRSHRILHLKFYNMFCFLMLLKNQNSLHGIEPYVKHTARKMLGSLSKARYATGW